MAGVIRRALYSPLVASSAFHTSSCLHWNRNSKWRLEHGLPENPQETSSLLERPDYSFVDGRPTPLGSNQLKRYKRNVELTEKAVQMLKELNYAVQKHKNAEKEFLTERQCILSSKLKPKGDHLIKSKKQVKLT